MEANKTMVSNGEVVSDKISMQISCHGFDVQLYNATEETLRSIIFKIERLRERYKNDMVPTDGEFDMALKSVSLYTAIMETINNVDIAVEVLSEKIETTPIY